MSIPFDVDYIVLWCFRLVDWCLEYCETQGSDMNPKAHRVFYSGCQVSLIAIIFLANHLIFLRNHKD